MHGSNQVVLKLRESEYVCLILCFVVMRLFIISCTLNCILNCIIENTC